MRFSLAAGTQGLVTVQLDPPASGQLHRSDSRSSGNTAVLLDKAWKWERQGAHAQLAPGKSATIAIATKPLPAGAFAFDETVVRQAPPTSPPEHGRTSSRERRRSMFPSRGSTRPGRICSCRTSCSPAATGCCIAPAISTSSSMNRREAMRHWPCSPGAMPTGLSRCSCRCSDFHAAGAGEPSGGAQAQRCESAIGGKLAIASSFARCSRGSSAKSIDMLSNRDAPGLIAAEGAVLR